MSVSLAELDTLREETVARDYRRKRNQLSKKEGLSPSAYCFIRVLFFLATKRT